MVTARTKRDAWVGSCALGALRRLYVVLFRVLGFTEHTAVITLRLGLNNFDRSTHASRLNKQLHQRALATCDAIATEGVCQTVPSQLFKLQVNKVHDSVVKDSVPKAGTNPRCWFPEEREQQLLA
eukprot:2535625-Amphidinium_carterae.1